MKKGVLEKIAGSIFLLFGLGFLFYKDHTIGSTGAVISTNQTADFVFIFSLILVILGGFLFFKSLIAKE